MFVALAEEGWVEGPIAEAVARRYLDAELAGPDRTRVDTVVLGCTHFPVFRELLAEVCGPTVTLVDSAETTASAVAQALAEAGLERPAGLSDPSRSARVRFLATDAPARFARVGAVFLGHAIDPHEVELVDL